MGPDEAVGEKAWWRSGVLEARLARSSDDLDNARAAIRRHVLAQVGEIRRVAAYLPLRTEPGSVELLADLRARGLSVLVPITRADHDLDWREWFPDGGGKPLGVAAIGTAGLVLVPALAVATDGTRLGRGGGSYDRALARRAPDSVVAALLFDDEVVSELPRDPWDVPVTAVVTPAGGWVSLEGNTEVGPAR